MNIQSLRIFVSLAVASSVVFLEESDAAGPPAKRAFVFRDVGYFHRWSKNDQHEFTPENQEDLNKWSDMMTVNGYPDVGDGERLAATANAVLENYKANKASVVKTDSVPRTRDKPAEHLIVWASTTPGSATACCSLLFLHASVSLSSAMRVFTPKPDKNCGTKWLRV